MATNLGDSQEAPKIENIVTRVTSLPLVSSAYDICSSLYNYAKGTHPYITTACSIAEMVVAVAVGGAIGGAQPLISHFEPQVAAANEYACKRLDDLEETLPYLHQPTHQVFEDGVSLTKSVVSSTVNIAMDAANVAKEMVTEKVTKAVDLSKDIAQDSITLTKSVVNNAVNVATEAKDLMTHRVADVVNLTKETVQDSVDLTKSVVSSTVNTALQTAHGTKDAVTGKVNRAAGKRCGAIQEGLEMTSFMRQRVAKRVDSMLEKTEEMVDHYLPITEEELVKLSTEVQGFDTASAKDQKQQQSYFVRLGSLSNKVRHRAYLHSLDKLRLLKENTQDTLSQLQLVINLIEYVKQGVGQQFQDAQQKLQELLLQIQPTEIQATGDTPPEQVESHTLVLLRVITQDLGPTFQRMVSIIEGLPKNIYERLDQAVHNIHQLHTSFSTVASFQDLTTTVLTQSQEKIAQTREALDALVKYVAENTPLNWVVGPFWPSPVAATEKLMETETSKSDSQEMAKTTPQDAGEAMTEMKEVTAPKPMKVVPKPAKEKEKEKEEKAGDVREGKARESTKALLEEAPSDVPKKAKKQITEAAAEKAGKSSLNMASEAPNEGP
ncbi:perilipin-3-like [Hemicordylus capensis]|uniref:perilipin-3-like n=1 Tax=Hemicordylus capensis TaxID=884348 RepID=UPI0023044FDE|nr:perilipin-3-like [Hemicordylus capensis]